MAYSKTKWNSGDIISAEKLNNVESGISNADNRVGNLEGRADNLETQVGSAISINDELAARVTKIEAHLELDKE